MNPVNWRCDIPGNIPQWFDFYVFPFDVEILLFDKFETMIFPTVDDRETPFFSSFLAEFFSFFAFSSFSFVSVFVSSFGLALFDENWLQGNSQFSFFVDFGFEFSSAEHFLPLEVLQWSKVNIVCFLNPQMHGRFYQTKTKVDWEVVKLNFWIFSS